MIENVFQKYNVHILLTNSRKNGDQCLFLK